MFEVRDKHENHLHPVSLLESKIGEGERSEVVIQKDNGSGE